MACNCGGAEQVRYLYEKYGIDKMKDVKASGNWLFRLVIKFIMIITSVFVYPYLMFVVLRAYFSKEKKISLRKTFFLKNEPIII